MQENQITQTAICSDRLSHRNLDVKIDNNDYSKWHMYLLQGQNVTFLSMAGIGIKDLSNRLKHSIFRNTGLN